MTEHNDPDDPDAIDEALDPADSAIVEQALGSLAFLQPADTESEQMPAEVWERLRAALAAEPAVAAGENVVALNPAARRPSRAARWAGGLVAASVAVVAVGVAVTAFQGSGSGGAVVAEDAVSSAEAITALAAGESAKQAPQAFGAPSASQAEADTSVLAGPETMSFAGTGMVTPALRLVQSDTDYTKTGLRQQVSSVLTAIGLTPEDPTTEAAVEAPPETVELPEPEMPGFLATPKSLRDCITELTREAQSTALMVDMATYEGQVAGVVVAPEYPSATDDRSEPDISQLEVWVVDEECNVTMKLRLLVAQ